MFEDDIAIGHTHLAEASVVFTPLSSFRVILKLLGSLPS